MSNKKAPAPTSRTWCNDTKRFAFTVGTAVSMNLVSSSGNLSHSLSYYARINYLPSEYAIAASLILVLVMCMGLALMLRGLRSGPPLLVGVATLNALLSAGYLGNHPITLFAVFPMFQSLVCLLMLNTRNHRRYVSILRVRRRREVRAKARRQ